MARVEVNVNSGKLKGTTLKNIDGFDFFAFKGIPYAKPPVGELRFQDPLPAEKWTGTRDALEFGSIGAQHDYVSNFIGGSDDCLYLNVYTKSLKPSELCPVMFYIHGGGFAFGSGNDTFYGPEILMKKDVVLVTINYRLGVLGFLDLGDEISPGNYGMKDQIMALQWVRDNIVNFGGDPKNVTIFGESAGGSSVHLLTLSPLSKGLFHRAIAQSGVATNTWASVPGDPKSIAYKLCEILGRKTTDHKEIVKFLRTVDTHKIIEAQQKVGDEKLYTQSFFSFVPGIDSKSPKPFMPEPLEIAAKKGANVPFIIGHNAREGTYLFKVYENSPYKIDDKETNFNRYLHPHMLDILKKFNFTVDDFKRLYFKTEKISDENMDKFIDLLGDMHFIYDIHEVVKAQVENNSAPTYMYQFTYDKGHSSARAWQGVQYSGTTHLDELFCLFNKKYFTENLKWKTYEKGSKHYRVMEQMLELWTNFAKTGRPTLTISETTPVYWKPVVDGTVLRYLNIGEELRMEKILNINERFYR